jgi:hypothetical protein
MLKNTIARGIVLALLVVMTAGCGGGGGGGGGTPATPTYTISLTTTALTFSGPELTTIPPQAVGVTFSGAGVVVGTPPGQTPPTWLVLEAHSQSSSTQVSFPIRVVTAGLAPGTYSTTLRFVTGDANGNNAVFADLPLTLTVREGFRVTQVGAIPGALSIGFNGVVSGATVVTPLTGHALDVRGEGIAWSVQPGAPAWIRVTPSSGSGPGTATVTAVTAGLGAGPHTGNIVFRDANSNRDVTVAVILNMSYPLPSIMPNDTTYSIDNATDASGTQGSFVVTDTAQGQSGTTFFNWTVDLQPFSTIRTTPIPLTASPTSGTTFGSATTVALNVDTQILNGLPSGTYTLPVAVESQPGGYSTTINAALTVRMPRLGTAVPYQIPANAAATIRLIGDDLLGEDLPRLLLDGQPLPQSYGATRLSAQEIELAVPAQSAGQHTITLSNTLGLPRSVVEFLVYTPPADPAGADLPGAGKRVQLVYDDARARLYAVDLGLNGPSEGELERYEWNGTSWADLGPLAAPGIRSAVKLRDGRRLAISSTAGVSTLDLNTPSAFVSLTDADFLTCGFGSPNELAVGEYGNLFMTVWGNPCTPYGHVMEYDLLNHSHDDPHEATYYGGPSLFYPGGLVAASGDGRYLAMAAIGHSGMDYALLDLRTRTYVVPKTQQMAGRRMQLDTAGTKVLLENTVIRDRAGAIQGNLPANAAARISPDGTRALIHVHGANGTGFLQLYDVANAVGELATYPTVGMPIPVPFNMGTPDTGLPNSHISSFALEWSADSEIAFVSGETRIVAIRLP